MVLVVHDGPWSRDSYGFSPLHQWLANRGYAVLSVNFRGSNGFGKAFLNAGNREWGGRMQEDLLDAIQWAVANGVAQPDHVAIMGSGFGGYAVLAGLAFAPDQFRCAAAFNAPANLTTLVEGAPAARRDDWYLRVGDTRTAEGRRLLRGRSPLGRASQMRQPLLLAMGAHDARSSRAEFDQITQSLRGRSIALTSLVFPEEGAHLARPQNRLAHLAVMEQFLGTCLGGRVEPVGSAFEGANLIAFDGASTVTGLSAFARRPAAPPAQPTAQEIEAPIETSSVPVTPLAAPPAPTKDDN
jgi:dipeptidyl aminopeptidase/acylaminoacyl peptidase